ncbi:MAG TPA: response regulator [Verrucomicrobiales bacterium]|nr:response regulator [Verrucomicrobiales bacterium]
MPDIRSGLEALKAMDHQSLEIDMVITDVVMPKMGGVELVEALRSRKCQLPVLFISGYPGDKHLDNSGFIPKKTFLQKPFKPRIFLQKIREIIDGAHLTGEISPSE